MLPEHEMLVRRGLPLVEIVARRVKRRLGRHVELDELLSIGRAALVEVTSQYEADRGTFEGFATQRLLWSTFDALRANRRGMIQARASALAASQRYAEGVREEEAQKPKGDGLDDLPSEEDAQRKLAVLLEGHAAAMALALASAQNDVERVVDPGESPEEKVAQAELVGGLREEVQGLPERERALVERHYYGDERFDAIASDLGISKAWASRLHASAITQLAKRIQARFGPSSLLTGT